MDPLTELTHTLADMKATRAKMDMQNAVLRWAVEHQSELTKELTDSLVACCEQELNREPKCR